MVSDTSISIGGAGGIGSYLSQWLARQRPKTIDVFDFDKYELVNAGSQFMFNQDNEINKAEVSVAHMIEFSNYFKGNAFGEFKKDSPTHPYVFTGFDNIKARRLMWNQWLKNPDKKLFIDGRLLMENFEIFIIADNTPERVDLYEKHLFDDSDVPELACTMKATTHAGAMIASLMVSMYNNFLTNIVYGEQIRDVPFHLLYDMALCNLEILEK